jgi:hypothetical protein
LALVSGQPLSAIGFESYMGWVSPGIPNTFDRREDDIGGARWREEFKREAVKLATQRELESSGGAEAGAREAAGLRT